MALNIGGPSIKKKDLADFFQKMAMLLDAGYDSCSAVELLAFKEDKKRGDHSADGIRAIANLLLPDLKEGFSLHESMSAYPKYFGTYMNQVEVGEASGKTGEVLQRMCDQIKNSGAIMQKLKGAMAYPIVTLVFTFAAATYLFTSVVPDMLNMLTDVGVGELPATTLLVMNFGAFLKSNALLLIAAFGGGITFLVIWSKTFGKMAAARQAASFPIIGKVIQNNSMSLFFKNWQQMVLAGAEMSIALKSATSSIPNIYIRKKMLKARDDYANNGIPVYEALRAVFCLRELELQTIHVAMEGGKLDRTLGILAEDREYEAQKSIAAMTAAINPIMMILVGAIVGVLVLSIYQPIISVSQAVGS